MVTTVQPKTANKQISPSCLYRWKAREMKEGNSEKEKKLKGLMYWTMKYMQNWSKAKSL